MINVLGRLLINILESLCFINIDISYFFSAICKDSHLSHRNRSLSFKISGCEKFLRHHVKDVFNSISILKSKNASFISDIVPQLKHFICDVKVPSKRFSSQVL